MSVLAAIGILANVVPAIAGWIGGDDAENKAEEYVGIAKKLTGLDDGVEAANAVANDPALTKLFEVQAHEYRMAELEEDTKRLEAVNKTMRKESSAEDAWTRRWRPYWGFVAATVFGLIALSIAACLIVMAIKDTASFIAQLPLVISALAALFTIPGAILGVTAHHRGKMQRIQAGDGLSLEHEIKALISKVKD